MALQQKLARAEPLYKRALGIFEQDAASNADAVVVLNDLASIYIQKKRYKDAESLLRRGLALAEKENPNSSTVREIRQQLAKLDAETGRKSQADANASAPGNRP
jgi:tetratricopeptide (TPR) repeat protein